MLGHLRICQQTGARAWMLWLGALINLSLFMFLFLDGLSASPKTVIFLLIALGGALIFETCYRLRTRNR